MNNAIRAVAWCWLAIHSVTGFAHTSLSGSTPKSGAELDESPPFIEITFRGEARLTSVVAVADQNQRKLEFTPKTSAASFRIENPQLQPGRTEIQWKALSKDGHVVSGTLIFTVKPKTP